MLESQKICKKGLDNSGNIEGNSNAILPMTTVAGVPPFHAGGTGVERYIGFKSGHYIERQVITCSDWPLHVVASKLLHIVTVGMHPGLYM
jgi:hypothetical protein